MSGPLPAGGSFTFDSTGSTRVIHNRKVETTEDLLPKKKFSCWKQSPNDEVSVDLPRLRRAKGCLDMCCNPLSVRYAYRPIVRPWPAVATLLFIAFISFAFSITLTVQYDKTVTCKVAYPSIILDPNSPEGQQRFIMDEVNYPWVDIGSEVDRTNEDDVFRVDEITIYPDSCNDYYEDVKDDDLDVALYYQLEPFYQNHRLYIFSRDNVQLNGAYHTDSEATLCSPMITLEDAKNYWGNDLPSWWAPLPDNLALDSEVVLHPCGLQAISIFNDTFELLTFDNEPKTMYTAPGDITLKEDIEFFNNPDDQLPTNDSGQVTAYRWMNTRVFPNEVEEGSFMNWMRLSTGTIARKLVGRTATGPLDLPIKVKVKNRYSVSHWDGEKYVVLTAQPAVGSVTQHASTPFWLLSVGVILLVVIFSAKLKIQPRLVGDIRLLHERKRLLHR